MSDDEYSYNVKSEALYKADHELKLLASLFRAVGAPMPWLIWPRATAPAWLAHWDLFDMDDVDHLAALPPTEDGARDGAPLLFDDGGPFGCRRVVSHYTPSGWLLLCGYHS